MSLTAPADTNTILEAAVKDLSGIPIDDRCFIRYIDIRTEDHEDMQATSLTMNYLNRETIIVRPVPVIKDSLLRVDLRYYAPEKYLQEFINTWEKLQYDPKFSLLLTKDTLKFVTGIDLSKYGKKVDTVIDVPAYRHTDGKTYTQKWGTKIIYPDVVRQIPEHIDKKLWVFLVDNTGSQAPIVSHKYFITRALTTKQDKAVFKEIYGGLYYEFAGIKRGFKKGTDEDNFLESLGIGNVEKGLTAKKIFDNLRSDQRVAVFRSNVSGRTRRADVLKTLYSRDGESIVIFTHDTKAQNIDIGQHAIMNLIDFKDDAREVIYVKQTGLHGFVLFNGKGELQDEVPNDVATDSTIPAPYNNILQPAIGCIRCHASEGGWRLLKNDVKLLLKDLLDVFNDTSGHNYQKNDQIKRLAGLYAGDPEFKILPRSRDDYASAIQLATGPWNKSKNQVDITKYASDRIAKIFNEYNYNLIGAKEALLELGVKGIDKLKTSKEYRKKLRELLPPVKIITSEGFIPEDPRIGALMVGLEITRTDWDLVYGFAADRLKKGNKK